MSNSSGRWKQRQNRDPFVKKAKQQGYRSRAAFKLLELQEKQTLFKPGMVVLELGAAPGGWSELIRGWLGEKGRLIALDILPMDPIEGVEWLQADIEAEDLVERLKTMLGAQQADWVISDMAPNLSGNNTLDQARSLSLIEHGIALAKEVLKPGGGFLTKYFQGAGADEMIKSLSGWFHLVKTLKPKASRQDSREQYVLGQNFQPY